VNLNKNTEPVYLGAVDWELAYADLYQEVAQMLVAEGNKKLLSEWNYLRSDKPISGRTTS
tara:strand:- start:920 stop:1099 length:180 start_codon:yes stop_codon:yes gene_type:complete